jgi:hypothetical protein
MGKILFQAFQIVDRRKIVYTGDDSSKTDLKQV